MQVGDAYRLDATSRQVYDCSPNSAGSIDQSVCGLRADTVDLDTSTRLTGRLVVTAVDTLPSRALQGNSASAAPTWEEITTSGTVEETTCDPECQVTFSGVRSATIQRRPTPCTPLTGLAACREVGDTVVLVVVTVYGDINRLMAGVESEPGRVDQESVGFGPPGDSLIVSPRRGVRVRWQLIRD